MRDCSTCHHSLTSTLLLKRSTTARSYVHHSSLLLNISQPAAMHATTPLPISSSPSMAAKVFQLALILTIFTPGSSSAELNKYPAFFNFGDSNSDTGNLGAGMGFRLPPPYGRTYPGTSTGRFSDGRLIVDFLMYAMDMPLLNPYLESVGTPSFHTGINFAASGATILPPKAGSICPFSFGVQVSQFSWFKARVLDLLSQSKESGEYLPAEDYFSKGLFIFDIGQNDLAGALDNNAYEQVVASIPSYLEEFQNGIQRLYYEGARNFWIHNTGPLGCLALYIAKFGTDESKLDELGCVRTHNQVAKVFNQQLRDLCQKFQVQYANVSVTYVDIFAIKLDLIKNYSLYEFEQPVMVCCGYGGPPLNCNSSVNCGSTVNLNGTTVTAKGCSDASKYVNWDGIHYTEAANLHVASQILTGRYNAFPLPDNVLIAEA